MLRKLGYARLAAFEAQTQQDRLPAGAAAARPRQLAPDDGPTQFLGATLDAAHLLRTVGSMFSAARFAPVGGARPAQPQALVQPLLPPPAAAPTPAADLGSMLPRLRRVQEGGPPLLLAPYMDDPSMATTAYICATISICTGFSLSMPLFFAPSIVVLNLAGALACSNFQTFKTPPPQQADRLHLRTLAALLPAAEATESIDVLYSLAHHGVGELDADEHSLNIQNPAHLNRALADTSLTLPARQRVHAAVLAVHRAAPTYRARAHLGRKIQDGIASLRAPAHAGPPAAALPPTQHAGAAPVPPTFAGLRAAAEPQVAGRADAAAAMPAPDALAALGAMAGIYDALGAHLEPIFAADAAPPRDCDAT